MQRLLFVFWMATLFSFNPAVAQTPQPLLKTIPLSITTPTQTLHYTVELALTPAQQETGLMYRTELKEKTGMLFVWPSAQPISMWMKNTLIPLDMVFIKDGVISQVTENAKPQSLDIISSGGITDAVLEIAGGSAAQYHIQKGEHVTYTITP